MQINQYNRLRNLYVRYCALFKSVSCGHHFKGCWEHKLILCFWWNPKDKEATGSLRFPGSDPGRWAVGTPLTSCWGVCGKPKDGVQGRASQKTTVFRHMTQSSSEHLCENSSARWNSRFIWKRFLRCRSHTGCLALFWEAKTTLITSTHGGEKACRLLPFPVIHSPDVARHGAAPGQGPQFCSRQPPGQPDERDR